MSVDSSVHPHCDPSCSDGRSIRRNRQLFCLATFFYWTSLYLYVPILPVYAESVVGTMSMVGVVIASYALPQLLLRIPVGLYFDSVSRRKPLIALSLLTCVAGAVGLAVAGGGWSLALARASTGVGAAGWVAFTVFFTRYYAVGESSRAIGTINAVNQVALVVATGSGGLIAEAGGYTAAFYGAAALGICGLVVLAFVREPLADVGAIVRHQFVRVASSPLLIASAVMAILLQFANFASVFGFVPVYGARIGASSSQLGAITMLTLGGAAVAAYTSVRLADRIGYSRALIVGAGVLGLSLLLVPHTRVPAELAAVQLVSGFGRGCLATLLMVLSIRSAPPGARATAMGVYQAVYAAGMMAGPMVSGLIADTTGLSTVFVVSAGMSFGIGLLARHPLIRRA
ncbi:MAG: MFS transporter [Dehalococcoidia bacterium]|nr:MFS transporter [Dehalococcoidia bacterium]